jgi:general secretion pathway protein D
MKRRRATLFLLLPGIVLSLFACAGKNTPPLSSGDELMQAGSYDEAVEFYMERLSETPQSVEARLALVRALRAAADMHAKRGAEFEKKGRLDGALMEYQAALKYNTEQSTARQGVDRVTAKRRAQEFLTKAEQVLDKGEVREAAHLLREAINLDPENAQVQKLYQEASDRLKLATEEATHASEEAATRQALNLLSTKPVTLRFKETDITEVLEIISKLAEVNILVDEGVRAKKVTSYVKDLPLRQAFGLILNTNRLYVKQVNDNSLVVIPDTPAKHRQHDDLQVRTFYLSNADAKRTVNLLRTILNTRQIFVDEELNAITVRDTPDKITLARKLIQVNDRGAGEVEIDLEILEVDRTKLKDFGITFTDRYQAAFFTAPTGLPATAGFVTGSALAGASAGGDLLFTNPIIFLNLVKNDSDAKLLANPTLRVLDRQKASIVIAERRPFAVSTISTTPGGVTETGTTGALTTTETRVEFRDIGLTLTFTPIIHLNGEVTIEINFEISNLGEPVQGDPLLSSVNTRNLNTFVMLRDGESRLLGGLIQDEERTDVQYSPFFGDLPLIGPLFQGTRKEKRSRDVIISMTLHVVKRLEPPNPEVSTFWAGTGESFGGGAAAAGFQQPVPRRTPSTRQPTVPGQQPRPAIPGVTGTQ